MTALVSALLLLAQPAASIKVLNQAGRAVTPFALSPQPPTVLLYILADCPISAKYSPEIGKLVRDYPTVRFFIVHVDRKATAAQARAHQKDFRIPCPELLDPKGELIALGKPAAVPTAVLFDPNNRIRYHGRIDDRFPALGIQRAQPQRRDLRIALTELLAGKPITVAQTPAIGCAVPKP